MAASEIIIFLFLINIVSIFFFFFLPDVAANITDCGEAICAAESGPGPAAAPPPVIHFPFRLAGLQLPRCGYRTGFDLYCNNRNQTVLRLRSGDFAVRRIDYEEQSLSINDPDGCLPRRFLKGEFQIFGSDPFKVDRVENYTFLNCSKALMTSFRLSPVSCLGNGNDNFGVFAVSTDNRAAQPFSDLTGDIRLTWTDPDCGACLARGGDCGFQTGSGTKIGCSVPPSGSNQGLPRGAKYGIIIGVGIPGLLCVIGLASYICGRVRACGQRRRRPYADYAGTGTPEPVVVLMGLDGPTIESFPKIQLGESKRLPKPNDNTCPICLSEYQSKETLRTIPECNHYFHASCVDEWLKMNATCPLCRNSPEGSSHVSPSSSVSSSSSSLASS
ncbi:43kDa postsynaptic protein [Parasponia andersonii]|uniref:RING-type E3 ubiquitin transferase n=1 Tax=Parasponia andersonii TaxID=3476 RepID=A0A2P5B8U3_PARAD|nr:43kDa postsynaptic protein [Parasponia andersonii]